MAIRKTGAVTGQVTEVEQVPQEQISATAARWPQDYEAAPVTWDDIQEEALAAENKAADQE
jgi:hypothetical protein